MAGEKTLKDLEGLVRRLENELGYDNKLSAKFLKLSNDLLSQCKQLNKLDSDKVLLQKAYDTIKKEDIFKTQSLEMLIKGYQTILRNDNFQVESRKGQTVLGKNSKVREMEDYGDITTRVNRTQLLEDQAEISKRWEKRKQDLAKASFPKIDSMEYKYGKRLQMTDEAKKRKDKELLDKIGSRLTEVSNRDFGLTKIATRSVKAVKKVGQAVEKWGEKVKKAAKSAARKISRRGRGE